MNQPLILPKRHAVLIAWTWPAIFLLLAIDAAWMIHAGIGFPHKTLYVILPAVVFLTAVSILYRRARRDDAIWLAAQITNQLVLASCALATFSYLGLRLDYPLIDAKLIALDERLGFDWLAYIAWAEHHVWVAHIFTLCYDATGPEILVLLVLLAFLGQFVPMHRFALGYLLSAMIIVVISVFWPALPAYVYRGIGPDAYPHLQVAAASSYRNDFFSMRNHAMQALPEELQGIIAFPSFHSALAVIAIYAALSIPSRILSLGIIAINAVMLLSTPVDGGHYLVDTLAGVSVGVLVIIISVKLLPAEKSRTQAG